MAERSPDRRIAHDVRETLAHDSRLRPEGISVRVHRGVAILTGKVGRHLDKRVAAEDAWRTKGVVEVRDQLQVQPDTIRGAVEMAADISEALARDDRVDLQEIVVEVAEGVVRLSGTVSSEAERRAIEEDVWRTEGIVDVSNEILVSADMRRSDGDVERDVRAALEKDAGLSDPAGISVRSIAGTVRLEGTVSSVEERETAEKDTWYTAGVVYVENLLRIVGRRERPAAA